MGAPKITDKRWSIDLEKRIQEEHYGESYSTRYSFDPASKKEIFVIDTPPPYPSGTWHIGAVAQYSMIDVIARSQRLLGKEVYFPWGVDRNGINIEFTVEKKTGKKMRTFERGEFIDICKETIEEYTQAMRETAFRVGLSCSFENEYLTDSPEYRSVTQSIFVDLFKQGNIIEDLRPNIYDPVEGTTIADAEVQRISRSTKLCDVIWETEDGEKSRQKDAMLAVSWMSVFAEKTIGSRFAFGVEYVPTSIESETKDTPTTDMTAGANTNTAVTQKIKVDFEDLTTNLKDLAYGYLEKYSPSKQQLKVYLLKKYLTILSSNE